MKDIGIKEQVLREFKKAEKTLEAARDLILQFMYLLDCKIQKIKNGGRIDSMDVEEILSFNWETLNLKLKTQSSELETGNVRLPWLVLRTGLLSG